MISKKMEDAINDQIAAEFYSAHLYLAMAAFLESIDLPGSMRRRGGLGGRNRYIGAA